MTKRNNKKTPEPMFVGTEPEEMDQTSKPIMNLEDFPTTSGQMEELGFVKWISEEPEKEPLTFQQIAEKFLGSIDGNLPTEEMAVFTPPGQSAGEKEYKHPFDPINDLHYQLNNAIQPLVDSMQKIIRDPYKAKESMSEQQFNYMVKEYGYLHSFLELSHKIIKERLRERS